MMTFINDNHIIAKLCDQSQRRWGSSKTCNPQRPTAKWQNAYWHGQISIFVGHWLWVLPLSYFAERELVQLSRLALPAFWLCAVIYNSKFAYFSMWLLVTSHHPCWQNSPLCIVLFMHVSSRHSATKRPYDESIIKTRLLLKEVFIDSNFLWMDNVAQ